MFYSVHSVTVASGRGTKRLLISAAKSDVTLMGDRGRQFDYLETSVHYFSVTGQILYDLITQACKEMSDEMPCLLARHLHERTITGRIAHLLQPLVPTGYFVDCEYNKMGDEEGRNVKKVLSHYPKDRVYPDIIIHKRTMGTADNLAVIEAKWRVSERQEIDETEKINFYLTEPLLLYKYGFLLVLDGVRIVPFRGTGCP